MNLRALHSVEELVGGYIYIEWPVLASRLNNIQTFICNICVFNIFSNFYFKFYSLRIHVEP